MSIMSHSEYHGMGSGDDREGRTCPLCLTVSNMGWGRGMTGKGGHVHHVSQ